MIKKIQPRTYQETIFHTAVRNNCLVVLPTGLGKTLISILLAAFRLENYPKSKILVLAPTKPLAEQHLVSFRKHLDLKEEEIVLFTGMVKPEKREELWKTARVVISTPQGIENDVITNRTPLADVSLIVFDEAHRAVGDYSYVFIAKQYHKQSKHERILALTASPGSDISQIEEVSGNLFIDEIEIRTEKDFDVKPYIQEVDMKWVEIDFPKDFEIIKQSFESCFKRKLLDVKENGYLQGSLSSYTKTALLSLQANLRARISEGEKDFQILKSISLLAEAMKVQHALELLESQGLEPLQLYIDKLEEQAVSGTVKAVKNLVKDFDFIKAKTIVQNLVNNNIEHPKIEVLNNILKEEIKNDKYVKIIIFTQYRSSASKIKKVLDSLSLTSKIFIGQSSRQGKGLTQKRQKEIIEEFANGEFNCLISTSVGEEGLDIPQVDLVVFYEPIPSAIRTIQRRGRTGRLEKGRIIVLMTKKTLDEAYRWTAHHKEQRMFRNLIKLKNKTTSLSSLNPETKKNRDLNSFTENEDSQIKIVVDHREKGSGITKLLVEEGIKIDLRSLEVGDYLLSETVVVEYKTKKDFVDSIIDGRLLHQLRGLIKYLKPIIILEGEEDIYSIRNIHPNAIRGMLSTITISYRIPIIYSKNSQDTAAILKMIAQREQDISKKDYQYHTAKPLSLKEQQEYLISALPNIGSALAKPLLKKFGSVKKVINAKEENLKKVDLIGDKKAKKIRDVIDSEYK